MDIQLAEPSKPALELTIDSASKSYPIHIGQDLLDIQTLSQSSVVLSDKRFEENFKSLGIEVVAIDASEDNKRLDYAEKLILALREKDLRRGQTIMAVGGGVVQDLATLVASLYMRGVEWVFAPTTLMAMVDSCVGGKSSINAGKIKNLIGNIYPPRAIFIDTSFVKSLQPIDIASGLAEAVKIVFCRGQDFFDRYLEIAPSPQLGRDQLPQLIHHTLSAKKWFIEIDEFDKKERQLLNFGHTFGHALEIATAFALPHGIAVSLGMMCALDYMRAKRKLTDSETRLYDYCLALTATVPRLSDVLKSFDSEAFEQAFKADKKHTKDSIRMVLPAARGVELVAIPPSDEHFKTIFEGVRNTVNDLADRNP